MENDETLDVAVDENVKETNSADDQEYERQLKNSVHYSIVQICKAKALDIHQTKSFMFILAELVYELASNLAVKTEAFARHSKRTTVSVDDVLLAAILNPSLKSALKAYAEQHGLEPKVVPRKRKAKEQGPTSPDLWRAKGIFTATNNVLAALKLSGAL